MKEKPAVVVPGLITASCVPERLEYCVQPHESKAVAEEKVQKYMNDTNDLQSRKMNVHHLQSLLGLPDVLFH